MNFETKLINGVTVFRLNEKRLDTNISGLIKGEFTMLFKRDGVKNLVIDLGSVESCDSSGLSSIIVANRIANSSGSGLRLAAPSDKVSSLIRITQLDKVLKVCTSVDQAISELLEE